LLVELLQQIRFNSGTEAQVDAYLTEWNMANERPSMPIPCPLCFLEDEAQRLNHLECKKVEVCAKGLNYVDWHEGFFDCTMAQPSISALPKS
jgi:hypothetical protein